MRIHTLLLTSLLTTSIVLASTTTPTKNSIAEMTAKQEGMTYIKMLGGTLKSSLQTHIKADKTGLSAMGFCTAKAADITKEVNNKLPEYASVRRTALKTRNTNNMPDALDIKVMQEYESSIAQNTFVPTDIKVVEKDNTIRIYKPLVTQSVCLMCHGKNISKEIQEIITTNYPQDKAVDFKINSLRGVMVAEIKKHENNTHFLNIDLSCSKNYFSYYMWLK